MKKVIFIVITIIVAMFVYINVNASTYDVIIPDLAIRVRVIAHSNSLRDQSMKMHVKSYIEKTISPKLIDVDNIEAARGIISSEIGELDKGIMELFREYEYDMNYDISFGKNYFPEKDYKGVYYKEGEYESLVVTIGSGNGDNWWCVLFPPLCLLEGDENDSSDVEYQFFVQKLLSRVFS